MTRTRVSGLWAWYPPSPLALPTNSFHSPPTDVKTMAHSTNPSTCFRDPNSKELMLWDKTATTYFEPEIQFLLDPGNAETYLEELKKYSKQYSYNLLLTRVPTVCDFAQDDSSFTFNGYVNMFKDWTKVTSGVIQQNATMTWGIL